MIQFQKINILNAKEILVRWKIKYHSLFVSGTSFNHFLISIFLFLENNNIFQNIINQLLINKTFREKILFAANPI